MTENNFQVQSAAVSDRGLSEKRPQNEDSFLEMRNLGLFAVADGVGGAQAGDVASQMAVEILSEAFVNLRANGDAEEMMQLAIERANSAIYQMSSDLPQLATMATTVVALQLTGNIATIGHVGDSRLYRLDAKGSLYRETQDHSVVEEEVRAGRMTAAQAANHPSRNIISRALGAESSVEVDMKTIMFDGNTKFLLCSDGITRHLSDLEIRELLLANTPPAEVCAKMKEICYSRGAEDNLTAVIIAIAEHIAVGNSFQTPVPTAVDEEATVATARQNITKVIPPITESQPDEIPTRGLEMPISMEKNEFEKDNDEQYLMEEIVPQMPIPPRISEMSPPNSVIQETADLSLNAVKETPAIAPPTTTVVRENEFINHEKQEKRGGGFFGKLLSSLVLLVVGAILGVAGYYFWQMSVPEKPVIPSLTPQTNNIQKTANDTMLFDAETNPEKVVKQYETTSPTDAADFYALGRAFLKLKNYEEAKRQFILARNNLKAVKEAETKPVLDAEITQGLVISQDKTAQAAYEREAKLSPLVEPSNQTPTNTNQ